ncbi:MAG: ATP-grasp domain-containing protein [Flavobacteriales bacterium]|nr:ATP-grasp domain-containing protein [Flavobacteriales bacterium]
MNLLFTSVGRRGYLLGYFRKALAGRGTLHAANSDAMAPAFLEADRTVITPLIHDPGYIDFLIRYCRTHGIRAIVPLFDVDIAVLAVHEGRFREEGTVLVCSSSSVAAICNDKWETHRFLLANGIGTARTWLTLAEALAEIAGGTLQFPVFVKPRWGMGSIGVFTADNEAELRVLHDKVQRQVFATYLKYESAGDMERSVLVQERLPGAEHGLDVVNDLDGDHIATFVKRKLAMRSGETDVACTVDEPLLRDLGARLSAVLRHKANLDVDVFFDGSKAYVLEMNARFGGGYPFSHMAGADIPRAIVSWVAGEVPDAACFKLRYGVTGVKVIQPMEFNIL